MTRFANFIDNKAFSNIPDGSNISEHISKQYDASQSWKDVQWLIR